MAPLTEAERRDFLEICDARYQTHSVLLTSQIPVASWHAQIGDPTIADSILDRLVHNAHRIELQGESMRRRKGNKGGKDHHERAPAPEVSTVLGGAKGLKRRPLAPHPTPRSQPRRLTHSPFVKDDRYSPASLRSDGDRHPLES